MANFDDVQLFGNGQSDVWEGDSISLLLSSEHQGAVTGVPVTAQLGRLLRIRQASLDWPGMASSRVFWWYLQDIDTKYPFCLNGRRSKVVLPTYQSLEME